MDRHRFIDACREGGQAMDAALRALYRDYARALLREGMACLGEAEAARELLQDALLKAWRRCGSFRGDSELFPWLKTILRRAAVDRLRRQPDLIAMGDDNPAHDVPADLASEPGRWLHDRQLQQAWAEAYGRFQREQPLAAQVIRWVAEDELTPADIAGLIGRSPGATREFISQCRKKARIYLAPWYALLREESSA